LKGTIDAGTDIHGTFEFFNQNSQVVFRPDADLDFDEAYTIILTNEISDVSDPEKYLSPPVPATFTTESHVQIHTLTLLIPQAKLWGQ